MRKIILVFSSIATFVVSTNVFAFHDVSEFLKSHKIVVCRNYNEEIIGNKIIIKNEIRSRLPIKKNIIVKEYDLPKSGDTINLYHNRIITTQGRYKKTSFLTDFVGTATITNESIIGDKYTVTELKHDRRIQVIHKEIILNEEDEKKIKADCLVATLNFELKNYEQISVDL
jgi:hypothetical protein